MFVRYATACYPPAVDDISKHAYCNSLAARTTALDEYHARQSDLQTQFKTGQACRNMDRKDLWQIILKSYS